MQQSSDVTSLPASRSLAGLDLERVSHWLANAVIGLQPPYTFAPVGQGRSNLTFLVADCLGRSAVLRRPPLGQLLASAHDVQREVAFLDLLSAQGRPVPNVIATCEDVEVTGAPFYLMQRVDGTVLDTVGAVTDTLTVSSRAEVGPSLARTLALLHTSSFDDVDFRRVVTTDGHSHAARQIRRWTSQWTRSKPYDVPVIDDIGRRLAAAVPTQREVTIVHGDFALHNAVFDALGQVRGVLDWEMATLGDPQSDLAWLLMLWPETPDEVVAGPEPLSLMDGFGPRSRLVESYVEASGRELTELPYWTALSYWKLTIAIAGIYQRWLIDPANGGAGADLLGAEIGPIAQKAGRAADLAGV